MYDQIIKYFITGLKPSNMALIQVLQKNGEMTAPQIAKELRQLLITTHKQLDVLIHSNIVERTPRGYRLLEYGVINDINELTAKLKQKYGN